MPFSEATKNAMLDSQTFNQAELHSGDPGPNGTANSVSGKETAVFDAAASSKRQLSSNVSFTGLTPSVSVTWFSVWETGTHRGNGQILAGDTAANANGEYDLVAAGTSLNLNDS